MHSIFGKFSLAQALAQFPPGCRRAAIGQAPRAQGSGPLAPLAAGTSEAKTSTLKSNELFGLGPHVLATASRSMAALRQATPRLLTWVQAAWREASYESQPQNSNISGPGASDEADTRAGALHLCHGIDEVLRGSPDSMGTS